MAYPQSVSHFQRPSIRSHCSAPAPRQKGIRTDMPKRVIDGEGLWRSDKLAQVEPPSFRAEYACLLPLALANGVFEANARRIWATVYSYNRPDVNVEQVEKILAEFERVKLLFIWTDSGKIWGYCVG